MASGPGSVPVVQPGMGTAGSDRLFRKPRDLTGSSTHYRPPRSLPDVCPKEPTGESPYYRIHRLSDTCVSRCPEIRVGLLKSFFCLFLSIMDTKRKVCVCGGGGVGGGGVRLVLGAAIL